MRKERLLNKYVDLRDENGRRLNANTLVLACVLAVPVIIEVAWALKVLVVLLNS